MPVKNLEAKTTFTAVDRFSSVVTKMQHGMGKLSGMASRVGSKFAKIGSVIKSVGGFAWSTIKTGAIAGAAAAGSLYFAINKVSDAFSMIEDATASFTPLMGSAERAKELVDALNQTASTTPFQFEQLTDVAKQLLPSMNGNIEETIKLTRMLGDAAGGNVQKMESVTRGFNKAMLKGKVDMESLNMIAEAGVPIIAQLGKVTGKTGAKLFKSISAGKVSVEDLRRTFEVMTSEGGIFFKGMEIASKTLTGKISTMRDNITMALAQVGEAISPVMKDLADEATIVAQQIGQWVSQNKELIKQKFKEWVDKIKTAFIDLYHWLVKNWPEIKKFAGTLAEAGKQLADVAKFLWDSKDAILAIGAATLSWKAAMAGMQLGGMAKDMAEAGGLAAKAAPGVGKLATALGKAGLLGVALGVGYAIGTLVDKLIEARQNASIAAGNAAVKAQRGLGTASDEELKRRLEQMKAKEKRTNTIWGHVTDVFTPGAETEEAVKEIRAAKQAIMNEQLSRQFAALRSSSPSVAASTAPVETISRNETTRTDRTELVIRDESGRAEITKGGKSGTVKLVPTGAMP